MWPSCLCATEARSQGDVTANVVIRNFSYRLLLYLIFINSNLHAAV